MDVLITGGAGYIGSTIASALHDAGHRAVILDNLVTGRREFTRGHVFYEGDVADARLLRRIRDEHPGLECVVHCAALTVAPESVLRPVAYYRENMTKTLELADALISLGIRRLVFSSTAGIYASPAEGEAVDEQSPLEPVSPYARSKAMTELMLRDISAVTGLRVLSLRYFNPVGADPDLRTGSQLSQHSSVLGRLLDAHRHGQPFSVTGTDYATHDGSALRDYLHVWDLAQAHVSAVLRFDQATADDTYTAINLGTGVGTTVYELVARFNEIVDVPVQVRSAPRRPGDTAGAFSRCERAFEVLGWRAERTLDDGIRDSLAWRDRRDDVLPDLLAHTGA